MLPTVNYFKQINHVNNYCSGSLQREAAKTLSGWRSHSIPQLLLLLPGPKPPSPFPSCQISSPPPCQWTLLNELLISVSVYRNFTRRHKWGLTLLEYIYMLKEFGNRKNFILMEWFVEKKGKLICHVV